MKPPPYPRLTGDEPCRTGNKDRFFPSSPNRGGKVAEECQPCPVRQGCFAWAVHHSVEGVWGGSTENERKAYQRAHQIVPERISTEPSALAMARWRAGHREAS